jgi:hypothetical protein
MFHIGFYLRNKAIQPDRLRDHQTIPIVVVRVRHSKALISSLCSSINYIQK